MFYDNLPKLDLHGEERNVSRTLINQFISDNIILGSEKILIIHGIGTGIIKKVTHDILKHDKRVLKYYLSYNNPGCTVVELKK